MGSRRYSDGQDVSAAQKLAGTWSFYYKCQYNPPLIGGDAGDVSTPELIGASGVSPDALSRPARELELACGQQGNSVFLQGLLVNLAGGGDKHFVDNHKMLRPLLLRQPNSFHMSRQI